MGKDPLTNATASGTEPPTTPKSAAAPTPSASFSDGEASGSTSAADTSPVSVTATVTPWAAAGLSEEEWNDLEIPAFLRRTEPTLIARSTQTSTASPPRAATAPAVDVSAGSTSGATTSAAYPAGVTGGMFDQFRVDPQEIEAKIKAEADRLYYTWEGKHRPRKSTLVKRVRKEYYK